MDTDSWNKEQFDKMVLTVRVNAPRGLLLYHSLPIIVSSSTVKKLDK